jgi:hypothetical protein
MPAQTTLPTPIPSTSRAPSNISNIASSSKSNNAIALTNALHPPPPPPTPQHAQHDAQTSTDDITQGTAHKSLSFHFFLLNPSLFLILLYRISEILHSLTAMDNFSGDGFKTPKASFYMSI